MKFGLVFALACALCSLGAFVVSANKTAETPLTPNTAIAQTVPENTVIPSIPETIESKYPVRLIIPSIKLDTQVVDVGVNKKGEMDVPAGTTKNVGWYQNGIIPGDLGTAVMDAH